RVQTPSATASASRAMTPSATASSLASASASASAAGGAPVTPLSPSRQIPTGFRVVRTYDHDRSAFTQGLLWHRGRLLESTGQHGQSGVRVVDMSSGNYRVVNQTRLDNQYFG